MRGGTDSNTGGAFYLTCLLFILVVLGTIAALHGFSIWKLVKEKLFIVLGTSSLESVLPRMMAKPENLGVKKTVVGLQSRQVTRSTLTAPQST